MIKKLLIKKQNYVYILECIDGTYYTGWTNDMKKRFENHINGKGAKYTKWKKPLKIVYIQECEDKSTSLKREIEIKNMSKHQKIKLVQNHKEITKEILGCIFNDNMI